MKVVIVWFPGSEDPALLANTFKQVMDHEFVIFDWKSSDLPKDAELIIVPGGSSFGDTIAPGRLAKITPAAAMLKKAERAEVPIWGIGNGFQILCHIGLLPGCCIPSPNEVRHKVFVKSDSKETPFKFEESPTETHVSANYGRYFLDKRALERLEEKKLVSHRFCDKRGTVTDNNPYLSSKSVAGVYSENQLVCGTIFHPERNILPKKITSGLPGLLVGR